MAIGFRARYEAGDKTALVERRRRRVAWKDWRSKNDRWKSNCGRREGRLRRRRRSGTKRRMRKHRRHRLRKRRDVGDVGRW